MVAVGELHPPGPGILIGSEGLRGPFEKLGFKILPTSQKEGEPSGSYDRPCRRQAVPETKEKPAGLVGVDFKAGLPCGRKEPGTDSRRIGGFKRRDQAWDGVRPAFDNGS